MGAVTTTRFRLTEYVEHITPDGESGPLEATRAHEGGTMYTMRAALHLGAIDSVEHSGVSMNVYYADASQNYRTGAWTRPHLLVTGDPADIRNLARRLAR